jgi:hypothetical protein
MAKEPQKTSIERTTYTLSEPVEINGEIITEIAYRKVTARDMRKWLNGQGKKDLGDRYVEFLQDICEQPAKLFDVLAAGDFMALTDIVDGFFARPKSAS